MDVQIGLRTEVTRDRSAEVCGLRMHPSADAVPQLFSISADIRGCLKKPKLRIIRGCRCVYAYLFSLNSTTLERLKYTISLLSVHMIVVITFASGAAIVKLICLPCHHIYSVLLTTSPMDVTREQRSA